MTSKKIQNKSFGRFKEIVYLCALVIINLGTNIIDR